MAAPTPLSGVVFKKDGASTGSGSPTIVNFTRGATFNVVTTTTAGITTVTVTIPADPYLPKIQLEGVDVTTNINYSTIDFIEGAALAVALAGGITTVTIPSGASATFSKTYFGEGAPVQTYNDGDLYFDTATSPYTRYVQDAGAWVEY